MAEVMFLDGITVSRVENDLQVTLPVPPSANERQTVSYRPMRTPRGPRHFIIQTPQVKAYYQRAIILRALLAKAGHRPIAGYADFHFQFYLENMRYDTHNAFKSACDLLEKAGAVTNDKYILVQTKVPQPAQGHPAMIVQFPYNP